MTKFFSPAVGAIAFMVCCSAAGSDTVKNAFDPRDNIRGGLAYLQWLWVRFKGDLVSVLAAYNAGEGAVETYHGIPPYPETRDYVRRVTLLYSRTQLQQLPEP